MLQKHEIKEGTPVSIAEVDGGAPSLHDSKLGQSPKGWMRIGETNVRDDAELVKVGGQVWHIKHLEHAQHGFGK